MSTVAHRRVEAHRLATIGLGVLLAVLAFLALAPRADPRGST